jgi:hypothetical protein
LPLYAHRNPAIRAIQARFSELQGMVGPAPRFERNHACEIYKAILKSLIVEDAILVSQLLTLAKSQYRGNAVQIYPMLHLAGDTNERGNWHRDGNERNRRVVWIPLTQYKYQGLSVFPYPLGKLLAPVLGKRLTIESDCYYSWPPQMRHKGNLNTSDEISSAMVIFLDKDAKTQASGLSPVDQNTVTDRIDIINDAIHLSYHGEIIGVYQDKLRSLTTEFYSNFISFFKLRTKIDLQAS